MRGQVLGFDYRTGLGEISGDDGRRYKFVGNEWRPETQPRQGQAVDFEANADEAIAIYALSTSNSIAQPTVHPNRIAAGLLALFLGSIGIHKFYLGQNRAGVIMLIVSVIGVAMAMVPTVIMAIIAFVEAVIYLTSSDEGFHQTYVEGGGKEWF